MTQYKKVRRTIRALFKTTAGPRVDLHTKVLEGRVSPIVDGLHQVYLRPGELLVLRQPCQITTVLGSCVAVTMFHARLGFAAICHGMLPEPNRANGDISADPRRFNYLSEAIPFMGARFRALGVFPHEVEVKIFGGGNVLGFEESDSSRRLVGQSNIEMAHRTLAAEKLLIKASSVGGDAGRKILFNTQTGEVLHKFL